MTGRDDKLPSVLVLAQDGRTAPLRTLDLSPLHVTLSLSCYLTNLLYFRVLLVPFPSPFSPHIYHFDFPYASHSHCSGLSKVCS